MQRMLKNFALFKKFLQELHRLQSDEDGSQGEYDIGQGTFLKFWLLTQMQQY